MTREPAIVTDVFDFLMGDGFVMVQSGMPTPPRTALVPCTKCASTGFADKVNRGFWVKGTCEPCSGTGWVNEGTGIREVWPGIEDDVAELEKMLR